MPAHTYLCLRHWLSAREGQSLVEYGLILFLVAVAVVGALTALGISVQGLYQFVVGEWPPSP
ncbi:MAG: Flp family type IVb pilin [Chloroflexota bacterium]|nr:Flp family type IVb pilin [Chloroflexota bacterium]